MTRILVIDGHPTGDEPHLCHSLADAYAQAATEAGHDLRRIKLADLDFPLLRSRKEWENGPVCSAIAKAQKDIFWAEHLVIVYPLWLGSMPALLKGFFEQTMRPGFAIGGSKAGGGGKTSLQGRSAHLVVTMGMPSWLYRLYFRAHSLKALKRSLLGFVGIRPQRDTIIGLVEGRGAAEKAIERMHKLGRNAR